MLNRFIAFDVEMPSQYKPRISAIGITVVEDGVVTDSIYYLVNPEAKFDPYVVELIGITPEMVANEPTFPDIWEKIKDVMSSGVLVAHGAPGDMKVLCGCLKSYGIEWKEKAQYICTCRVGLEKYPEYEHHSLDYMCQKIAFPLIHHYALSDSEGCAHLMLDYINKGVDVESYIQDFDVIKCRNVKKKARRTKNTSLKSKVRFQLFKMQNKNLRDSFALAHKHIDPSTIIGIKAGSVVQYAEQLVASNRAADYINILPHDFYEENLLHAVLVSKTKKLSSAIARIDAFLPYVNDTTMCRLLVPTIFRRRQPQLTQQILLWLNDSNPYTVFFALEVISRFFKARKYIPIWKDALVSKTFEESYLNNKKIDLLLTSLIFSSDLVIDVFENHLLDQTTHNKIISLALENAAVSEEKKEEYKKLLI